MAYGKKIKTHEDSCYKYKVYPPIPYVPLRPYG